MSVTVSFYFDDADPCAECECGWHTHGDAAVDAFIAWWMHLRDKPEHIQAMSGEDPHGTANDQGP